MRRRKLSSRGVNCHPAARPRDPEFTGYPFELDTAGPTHRVEPRYDNWHAPADGVTVHSPSMLAFTLAVLLLLITPGPGVLSTAGVGAAFGFKAGLRYVFGLCIGTNLVALIVVSGLAAIILAITWARNTLLVMSALYLLYIAVRIAFAGKKIAFIHAEKIPGIRDALILQIINPKAYAVNMTWFTGFVLVPESLVAETLLKFLIINLIWIPIHLLWLAAGNLVNQLDLSPRAHFLINSAMALALVVVVGLAIFSLI